MPRLSQTAAEQAYFQLFAQHYPLPEGKIVFGDKPDVQILGSKSIGIEIANLHKQDGSDPTTEKVQAIFRNDVIELAERMYRDSGEKRLELWIDFDPDYPIVNVRRSAKALAEIAIEISRQGGDHNSYKAFDNAPELRFLTCNGIEYPNAKWHSVQTHDVPSLVVDRVRALVVQKARKVQQYRACDVYWLLLIVEFWDPSQDQYIEWPEREVLGETLFERVLIYKPAFKQITEVPR